jgi:hypothetical protein
MRGPGFTPEENTIMDLARRMKFLTRRVEALEKRVMGDSE